MEAFMSVGILYLQLRIRMLLYRLVKDQTGQDFAEYALLLGAIGVVALAVIVRYREELISAFESGIAALRAAH
jgi:Flp pilus assembly pilin Flp